MTTSIRFSQFQRAISTVGAILAITCGYSTATSHNEKIKNFALNLGILSAGIGLTAEVVAAMTKDGILKQIEDFENLQRNETKTRDTKLQSQTLELGNVKKIVESLTTSNTELINERDNLQKAIELLKGQVELKVKSLDTKLNAEDSRYSEMVIAILNEL